MSERSQQSPISPLRRRMIEAIDAIHDRIGALVQGIPACECANYLKNAGYASI